MKCELKVKPIMLSEKSQKFLQIAEAELGSCGLNISYYTDDRRGILLTRVPLPGITLENQVVIDDNQAHRILQYLVDSGLLDTSGSHSRDQKLGGWNAVAGTNNVQAHWHLGAAPDAPLEAEKFMGLRSVLQGRALEAWDRFLKRLREPGTANANSQQD